MYNVNLRKIPSIDSSTLFAGARFLRVIPVGKIDKEKQNDMHTHLFENSIASSKNRY